MKIMVTVKQVPDTSGKVAVNDDGTLNRASMQTIINPDDLNAVEAALALKDEYGCEVVAFTMGPAPAEGMLRELMAMGVDETVLISAREFGGSDTYATSQIIAAAIDTYGLGDEDIIIAGMGAETIIEILEAAPWVFDGRYNLVLVPATKHSILRRWLNAARTTANSSASSRTSAGGALRIRSRTTVLVTFGGTTSGEIRISDSEGNVVASYTPEKEYQCVVISHPDLKVGETYTVTGGDLTTTVELTDTITGSGFGGMGGFPGLF